MNHVFKYYSPSKARERADTCNCLTKPVSNLTDILIASTVQKVSFKGIF